MGETDVETMGNVTVAKYDFDDEAFNDISEEALSFITHLLVKEPEKRMTAPECLQHDWLLRRAQQTSSPAIPSKVQLISDLSSPVCLAADNDADSSTLSDIDNSESDYGVEAMQEDREVPPPLPKTQPPPFELLMETSLPIIILAATTKEPSIAAAPVDTMDDPPRTTAENITERVIKTQSHFEWVQFLWFFLLIKSPAMDLLFMRPGLCLLIIATHCPGTSLLIQYNLFSTFSLAYPTHSPLTGPGATLLWP